MTKKKKTKDKTREYQATASIIGQVYNVIEDFEDNSEYYSASARKLASKIIAEWAQSLRAQIAKVKRPKKSDIQLAAFLEGYSKFLL